MNKKRDIKEVLDNPGFRMYSLVLYNLSPIQQGIQMAHAAIEYYRNFNDSPDFINWVDNHKTMIVLNGGTSCHIENKDNYVGTMEGHIEKLLSLGVNFSSFNEPDLNYALTAISFIASEKIYGDHIPDLYKIWEQECSYIEKKTHSFNETPIPSFSKYLKKYKITLEQYQFRIWLKSFKLA